MQYNLFLLILTLVASFFLLCLRALLFSSLPTLFFTALLCFLPMGGQYIGGGVFPLFFIAHPLRQINIYENFLTTIREKDSKKQDKDAEK
jgi:hypothetical protein